MKVTKDAASKEVEVGGGMKSVVGNMAVATYQHEALEVFSKVIGWSPHAYSSGLIEPPVSPSDALRSAMASVDDQWARELGSQGAVDAWNSDELDETLFDVFMERTGEHENVNARRLASMCAWLDESGGGLLRYQDIAPERPWRLKEGGVKKRDARLAIVEKWVDIPQEAYWGSLDMDWVPAMRAMAQAALRWSVDKDAAARVSVDECLDAMVKGSSGLGGSAMAVAVAAKAMGTQVGAMRWSKLVACLSKSKGFGISDWFEQALIEDSRFAEPLDEKTATRLVALSCWDNNARLLARVCARSPSVDWSLGEVGASYAYEAIDSQEKKRLGGKGKKVAVASALHLSRLGSSHRDHRGRGKERSAHEALLGFEPALAAARQHPFPEAFKDVSVAEMLALCKIVPELAQADDRGRTFATSWVLCHEGTDGIDKIRRLLGTRLAGMVGSKSDAKGADDSPLELARRQKGWRIDDAVKILDKQYAEWEAKQMRKEVGARKKAPKANVAKRL